jgi:Protein of unknown function (DUF3131)
MEREITNYRSKINLFMMKPRLGHAFLRASLDGEPKKTFFKNPWHISKKAKSIIGFVIIVVLLVSIFAFLPKETPSPAIINVNNTGVLSPTNQPTPSATNKPNAISDLGKIINRWATDTSQAISPSTPLGIIESAQTIDSNTWKSVAENAWKYFQPEVGVNSNTGLPCAGLGWPYFTDWDLGVYIQAVIDANKTGLIDSDGDWGSSARLDKVLTFLEHRDLNNYSYPFWFYQAEDGQNYKAQSDLATGPVDGVDTGRLLVALNNLRDFNTSSKARIASIVARSPYAALVNGIKSDSATSSSIYAYYVVSGFASFFPDLSDSPDTILTNMFKTTIPSDNISNILLPKGDITCEPLLHAVFELKSNPKLTDLARSVYLAHEARYNATGKYVAFSEGNSGSDVFIYEWVVLGDGSTWKVTDIARNELKNFNPIIYTKVAISFLALYNTKYARDTVVYLEKSFPEMPFGYYDGADYTDQLSGRNLVLQAGSNTNGLIIEAARYAIQNNP